MKKEPSSIATEEEVLTVFTSIMRGELPDDKPKVAEVSKAAELLGKHYGLFDGKREKPSRPKSDVSRQIEAALKELKAHDQP